MSIETYNRYRKLPRTQRLMFTQMIYPTRVELSRMLKADGSVAIAHLHDKAAKAILTVLEGKDLEV